MCYSRGTPLPDLGWIASPGFPGQSRGVFSSAANSWFSIYRKCAAPATKTGCTPAARPRAITVSVLCAPKAQPNRIVHPWRTRSASEASVYAHCPRSFAHHPPLCKKGLLALARSPPEDRRKQAPLPLWLSFGSTQRGVSDPAAWGEALIRHLLSRPLASLDVSGQRRLFACTPRLTRCEFGAAANIFRAISEGNGPFGPTLARRERGSSSQTGRPGAPGVPAVWLWLGCLPEGGGAQVGPTRFGDERPGETDAPAGPARGSWWSMFKPAHRAPKRAPE